jgi:hypothetical protein
VLRSGVKYRRDGLRERPTDITPPQPPSDLDQQVGTEGHHICICPGIGTVVGTVNQGTLAGATATPIATASSTTDTPAVATLRHGSNFSAAISPETTSIQVRLIYP